LWSIAVCEGDPWTTKSTATPPFFFDFTTASPRVVIHVIGPSMGYYVQVRDNYDPTQSRTLATEVQVGWLTIAMTKAHLVLLVSQNYLDNSSQEFSCQTWVGAVLKRLREMGYLSQKNRSKGVNGMVDATLEAEDGPWT
ncbi:hypothetical protein LTS18_011980, partial [Coniosporium uncinatum]